MSNDHAWAGDAERDEAFFDAAPLSAIPASRVQTRRTEMRAVVERALPRALHGASIKLSAQDTEELVEIAAGRCATVAPAWGEAGLAACALHAMRSSLAVWLTRDAALAEVRARAARLRGLE